MKKITVVFYKNSLGKEPVRDFIKGFSKKDKEIIGIDIKMVEFGWPIGMPVCRPLGAGLYEVRSTLSSKREVRVVFCIYEKFMILLHAFIKKTQKTPIQDMAIAKQRQKEIENE